MNIRDLEYLVALAEHRHFRRAADSCHVSQPTLSGQIRKLEDELGVMLLERTSRKVLFTQAGLLLVEQARTVLREVKVLKEMASQQGETMSGPLHIGLIPTVGPYLLPQIIPMLHRTFPKLEMYLHEAQTHQLLAQLDSGKLDCAILAMVKESEAFIEVPLFDEPMKLAIYQDHPWANRERVAMSDLAGEKLLMLEDGHCLRDQAMGFCFQAGADEDTHFRATSLETLRNMVAAGSGITLLPSLSVPRERVSVMASAICHAINRSLNVPSRWCIALVHRCADAMSSLLIPSASICRAIWKTCQNKRLSPFNAATR
ncbi:DNA-binding transcriptional regulator OxyR [Pectobacterium zantedeschiae]|uniref:DNA-binding transcriptional regulator OxyR n=5 Tax=Enterobacterales TaxID=91347 RepID=UPI003753F10C